MPIYEQTPILLQVSLLSDPPVTPININTNGAPKFWRASSVGIAIGIFDASGNPVDLSNLAPDGELQLFLFKSSNALVPLVSKTIAGADLYPLITREGWEDGTQKNCTFVLSPGDTDQGLNGAASADFWLVLNGITEDGSTILYAAGTCTIYNASNALPASSLPTPSYNTQDSNAGNLTVTPTSNLHTEVITLSGVARTSKAILTFAGLTRGAILTILIEGSGAAPGINLELFIGSLAGSNPFRLLTDSETTNAMYRFYFDGATLQPMESIIPAYVVTPSGDAPITDNLGNPIVDNDGNPITPA
jgi:hypothetical protein